MDLKRFFSEEIGKEIAVLRGDEFYHAVKVTRHKVGYKLIICGDGTNDYYCTVTDITSDALYARIDRVEINDTETEIPVVLFIGANKDLDTVVQKAVELGVSRVVPFVSDHGNVFKLNYDRLNKIILESSKQCGRAKFMQLDELMSLKDALNVAKNTNILFFYEFERTRKVSDIKFDNRQISVFIGPEGGFSEGEVQLFKSIDIQPLTLGKRILRVGTAVNSAIALVMNGIGEM